MKQQMNSLISEYQNSVLSNEEKKKKLEIKFRQELNNNANPLDNGSLVSKEIKTGQTEEERAIRELEKIKAYDTALLMLKEEARNVNKPLTESFIKGLNQAILVQDFWKDAIAPDEKSMHKKINAGQYKGHPNPIVLPDGEIIEHASPEETPALMSELVAWYNEEEKKKDLSPVELAALLHYRFIRIHPFDDGNGRVARLLLNYVLYKNNLPPVVIQPEDKNDYFNVLQKAHAGNLTSIIDYVVLQLVCSLDISIKTAKGEDFQDKGDWKEQLSILKKGLTKNNGIIEKKTEKNIARILKTVVASFYKIYKEKIEEFSCFFMDLEVSFYIDKHKETEIPFNEPQFTPPNLLMKDESLVFECVFKELRKPYKDTCVHSIPLKFTFRENGYIVSYEKGVFSKLYDEILLEEEIQEIMSAIGKDLFEKVKQKMKE